MVHDGGVQQLAGGGGELKKARKSWARSTRILGQEGAEPRMFRMFFKAVVQLVLICGSEMWVLTPAGNGTWAVLSTGLHVGSPGIDGNYRVITLFSLW